MVLWLVHQVLKPSGTVIETFEGDYGPPFETRIRTTTGGNPNLKPETSYGYLLGFVAEPPFIPGL